MYLCEGQRQKKYLELRRAEEINAHKQQEVLDGLIATELGLDTTANQITSLAKRVINKVGEQVLKPELNQGNVKVKATDIILNAIKTGKWSELFTKMKAIPTSKLTKIQQIIQKDMSNPEVLRVFNEDANDIIKSAAGSATDELFKRLAIDLFDPKGDGKNLEEMAKLSESGSDVSGSSEGTTLTLESFNRANEVEPIRLTATDANTLNKWAKYWDVERFSDGKYNDMLKDPVMQRIFKEQPASTISTTKKSGTNKTGGKSRTIYNIIMSAQSNTIPT